MYLVLSLLVAEVNNDNKFTLLKRIKSHSVKRFYQSYLPFSDAGKTPTFFPFYKDNEVGFTSPWRANLILQSLDNDEDSDQETIQNGIAESIYSIQEAISTFKLDPDCLRNIMTVRCKSN